MPNNVIVHSKSAMLWWAIMHGVESPSTVDPQWDIWYWGSKWNLHTVCWSAVGCEWGTTSVYFGITYVCSIPSRLPVFAVEPQYLLQDVLFLSKVSFEGHIQNLQKISCWFKIWMGFVGPKLIKLWTSLIWSFLSLPLWWTLGNCLCKHAGHHSVTTGACSPPHLTCLGLCSMAAWKLNGPICAMGHFDWPVRWLNPSDFPSYDIQNMASIHVQNISKQQFYCLSVITYLECIKITFKSFQNVWFWYLLSCLHCRKWH